MERKEIPVFFAVDDNYIPFLAVTIKSLIANSSKENNYALKILYTKIGEENQKKIKKYEQENISIEFMDVTEHVEKIMSKLYTRDYFSMTTYFRLFIPDLYPQYDKAIYIDSDTVLKADIAEMYNIDIENYLIGAVQDGAVASIEPLHAYVEKVVGVADYHNYFNAGVIIMNLKELRQHKFQEKFLYLLETVKFSVAQDQDYLNRICKGRVKIIDSGWDAMPMEPLRMSDEDLKIIHFNLGAKPWHHDNVLYDQYFWKYAEQTEFLEKIKQEKANYTDEDRFNDEATTNNLIALAKKETECVGDDRNKKKTEKRIFHLNLKKD